jgi:pimeloyl-ACP methyl ester carboxylesterase
VAVPYSAGFAARPAGYRQQDAFARSAKGVAMDRSRLAVLAALLRFRRQGAVVDGSPGQAQGQGQGHPGGGRGVDETLAGPGDHVTRPLAPTVGQKLWGWARDYGYVATWMLRGAVARSSPDDLLVPPTGPRAPVLLIPGVYENWRFLQPVADHLYQQGHPVHVLDKLGYNTGAIPDMAVIVREYLQRLDLHDVTVIAHSKGGLIAKFAAGEAETLTRIRRVITINTPFSGSRYAYLFLLLPSVRMFTPTGALIRRLARDRAVNAHVSSLYSVFDPHIPESSNLPGAENIVLPTIGHFRPIADPLTLQIITDIMARASDR